MSTVTHRHLIDLSAIHQINRSHMYAIKDLYEADEPMTLIEVRAKQLIDAEANLIKAIEVVLARQESAHMGAVLARPNPELEVILETSGIKTTDQ